MVLYFLMIDFYYKIKTHFDKIVKFNIDIFVLIRV